MKIEGIIFDLDNTLYPRDSGLFDAVDCRITLFLRLKLGLDEEEALRLRSRLRRRYHITLRGLMAEHGVAPGEFLEFVHSVPVGEWLDPDPGLGELLAALPCPRWVFTNGSREYAARVLSALGVERLFSDIFDIAFTGYVPKPELAAYRDVVRAVGSDPARLVYVDDLPQNLVPAAALGMTTILLRADGSDGDFHHRAADREEMGVLLRRLTSG